MLTLWYVIKAILKLSLSRHNGPFSFREVNDIILIKFVRKTQTFRVSFDCLQLCIERIDNITNKFNAKAELKTNELRDILLFQIVAKMTS